MVLYLEVGRVEARRLVAKMGYIVPSLQHAPLGMFTPSRSDGQSIAGFERRQWSPLSIFTPSRLDRQSVALLRGRLDTEGRVPRAIWPPGSFSGGYWHYPAVPPSSPGCGLFGTASTQRNLRLTYRDSTSANLAFRVESSTEGDGKG